MQQKFILGGAILFAVLAFVLSGRYMVNQKKKLFAGNRQILVLAAAKELNEGMVITLADLGKLPVFENSVGSDVFLSTDENLNLLINKRVTRRVEKKEVLRYSDVDIPYLSGGGFAETIGTGVVNERDKIIYRAVSVPVSVDTAVAGLIRPTDRVDVIGTYVKPVEGPGAEPGATETVTRTLLQNVTVLATGQEYATARASERARWRRSGSYSTLSLQVTPREAELLVFIQQAKGKLTFTLRRPNNLDFEETLPKVDFRHIDNELETLNRERQEIINNPLNR